MSRTRGKDLCWYVAYHIVDDWLMPIAPRIV